MERWPGQPARARKEETTDEHRSAQMWGFDVKPRPVVALGTEQAADRAMTTLTVGFTDAQDREA